MGVAKKNTFFDFTTQKSWLQAVLFFIATVVITLALYFSTINVLFMFGAAARNYAVIHDTLIGKCAVTVVVAVFSYLILEQKNYFSQWPYLAACAAAFLLAIVGGGVGGLLILAFLTTRKKHV